MNKRGRFGCGVDLNKTHPKNLIIGKTKCCGSKWTTIPACMGDPSFTMCVSCNKEINPKTDIEWKPMYENVGQGTWRKIDYNKK